MGILNWIIGPLTTFFALLRSMVISSIRFKREYCHALLELLKEEGRVYWLREEIQGTEDRAVPRELEGFALLHGIFIHDELLHPDIKRV